ncbi:MAG: DUF3576 domain-containing protein [Paracoccaceae bacterium]
MTASAVTKIVLVIGMALAVSGCGRAGNFFRGGASAEQSATDYALEERLRDSGTTDSIWDLFASNNPSTSVNVNRYLWTASLETLDFLPIETVDPFSGVITTGFGTPPGGGRPYRATIQVTDAALDARSLNVALVTRNGPASQETVRAVENAILTRARQLRIRDRGL